MQEFNEVTNSSAECLGKLNILPRLEVGMSRTHQNFKILGTAGYRAPRKFQKLGPDGYRVPTKFRFMPTPGFDKRIFLIKLLYIYVILMLEENLQRIIFNNKNNAYKILIKITYINYVTDNIIHKL